MTRVDWQNVLGIAATIFALASAAGLGLMRGQLQLLRDSRDDLQTRVTILETERTTIRTELTEVKSENKLLNAMVTGKVEWTAISDQLEEHHRQALASWKNIGDRLDVIHTDLSGGP